MDAEWPRTIQDLTVRLSQIDDTTRKYTALLGSFELEQRVLFRKEKLFRELSKGEKVADHSDAAGTFGNHETRKAAVTQ